VTGIPLCPVARLLLRDLAQVVGSYRQTCELCAQSHAVEGLPRPHHTSFVDIFAGRIAR